MKIFFARHGQYENPDNILPLRMPGFPLTPHGIAQVEAAAQLLLDQQIRAIYTSSIERCLQTAKIYAQILKLYPNPAEALMEIKSGFEGHKNSEKEIDFYSSPIHQQGGGETKLQVFERVSNFIEKLKQTSNNSNYLIVSHGDPIMVYLRKVMDKELRYIPMGGLVCLSFNKKGIPTYQELV